ncbi:MAG: FmdB family zinc ribbon protein [Chloroflexota bacterium]
MPIYEYVCRTCGEKFECRRGLNESDEDIRCPHCGALAPDRAFSSFASPGSLAGGGISCLPRGGFT